MRAWKDEKYSRSKTGIRFYAGLCLVCCGLLIPALSAKGLPIGGITVKGSVIMPGNNIIDSFDSSDPSHSVWHTNWWFQGHNFGTYTNSQRTDQAVVGTDASVITLDGGVSICGYMNTGPGGAVALMGNGNSVGDLAWVNGGSIGIQPGHSFDNMNVIFGSAVLPTPTNTYYPNTLFPKGKWMAPGYYTNGTSITVAGVARTFYIVITNISSAPAGTVSPGTPMRGTPTNKIYYLMDYGNNPTKGTSLFIGASNVVVYLTNGISLKNNEYVVLDTNNSSVEMYSRTTFDVGNGQINNSYQYAPPFRIFGLPTCTSINFPGNANLTASVYAPQAFVTFNGGGSGGDVSGAFIALNIELSGHINFHYDVVLKTNEPPFRYVASSWQEVH